MLIYYRDTLLRHIVPTSAYRLVTCVMGVAYKIYLQSQIFLRCVRADLDLILNEFKQIGFIRLIGCLTPNGAIMLARV